MLIRRCWGAPRTESKSAGRYFKTLRLLYFWKKFTGWVMKFIKWLVIVLIGVPVLLVAGIYVRNKSIGPVGWAEDNTVKALRQRMKDSDSMVIRSSYIVQITKPSGDVEISICGIADGRNSFRGFDGGTRFVSVSSDNKSLGTFDTHIVQMDDSSASEKAEAKQVKMLTGFEKIYWNGHCVDDTHPALVVEN
jgi:hypothetical protein